MEDFQTKDLFMDAYEAIDGVFAYPQVDKKSICHYTSNVVLDAVLSSATFRAAHVLYLNDSSELIKGLEYLSSSISQTTGKAESKKYVKELLDEIMQGESKQNLGMYSISFSGSSDILHQWITYAKESGVCIVLDPEQFRGMYASLFYNQDRNTSRKTDEKDIKDKELSDVNKKFLAGCRKKAEVEACTQKGKCICVDSLLREMKYENEMVQQHTADYIIKLFPPPGTSTTELLAADRRLKLLLFASFVKNGKFQSEEEIRATFFPQKTSEVGLEDQYAPIKYYLTPGGILRPYFEVTFGIYKEGESFRPLLPIKELVIGPSGNQQTVFDSVVNRVKYGGTKVFDYWEEKKEVFFDNFFNNYLEKAVKRFAPNDDEKIAVFREIVRQYDRNVNNDFINELQKQQEWSKYAVACEEPSSEIKRMCAQIQKDNYFAAQGIWIHKSEIPYIFTQ